MTNLNPTTRCDSAEPVKRKQSWVALGAREVVAASLPTDRPIVYFVRWGTVGNEARYRVERGFYLDNPGGPAFEITVKPFSILRTKTVTNSIARIGAVHRFIESFRATRDSQEPKRCNMVVETKRLAALEGYLMPRACLFAMLVVGSWLTFPQEKLVIRVGVAVMRNNANRSVPGELERDRLVKALNDEKPDKKLHLKVQGVGLEGMNPEEAAPQADENKCDYVVYTTLTELRTQGDPSQRRPGTFETNPNAQRPQSPETAALNPEYHATMEYRLFRTGDRTPISGAPFSTQAELSEIDVVSQLMDRVANRVFAEIKKSFVAHP